MPRGSNYQKPYPSEFRREAVEHPSRDDEMGFRIVMAQRQSLVGVVQRDERPKRDAGNREEIWKSILQTT